MHPWTLSPTSPVALTTPRRKSRSPVRRLCRDAALTASCFLVAAAGAWGLDQAVWECSRPGTAEGSPVMPMPFPNSLVRDGNLKVGDTAPDFTLTTQDGKSTVTLSAYRGKKPVVLIFGSLT